MKRYVLALDQGTTSSRAIVFGHDGRAVATAQQEFPQIFPGPGHVEHDPEAIWSSQTAVAREALTRAGASATDIAAIGVTNQRETTVLWDRHTGKPVANAIVWQSRVSAPICDAEKTITRMMPSMMSSPLPTFMRGTLPHARSRRNLTPRQRGSR